MSMQFLNDIEVLTTYFIIAGGNAMKRPYMVEILGTPEAGKTTAIKELIHFLSKKGYKIYYVQESAEIVPKEFKKGSKEAHVWMRLNTARNMMFAKECNVDIVLIDRGTWDTLFWNSIFYEKGEMSKEELNVTNEFFKCIHIFPQLIFILKTEVEEVISRKGGEGRIVTREFIKNYNDRLMQFQKGIFPSPVIIDTTQKSKDEVSQYMENIILQNYKKEF